MSYILVTRSGNEIEFTDMVARCNRVGVRIYVDIIINHMAARHPVVIGTAGSDANPNDGAFPAVAYTQADFNEPCEMTNFTDPLEARNCELVGLRDLNQRLPLVREKIIGFLNKLVEIGVAGFRVDAAKHMWPEDLKVSLHIL